MIHCPFCGLAVSSTAQRAGICPSCGESLSANPPPAGPPVQPSAKTVDLASGTVRVLTRGRLDESPSFAPNGAMLMYAGRERGQSTLATVSVDALTSQRLKSDRGQVREPAWGPFAP